MASLLVLTLPGCTPTPSAGTKGGPSDVSRATELLPIPSRGLSIHSDYSHIVLRETGSIRTLFFVDDAGTERVESRMDVRAPERLQVPYTRSMFASYLFVPKPKRVLLIGVGAGSMVRFLRHYEPHVVVDAVDIDPVVLRVAADYFGTRSEGQVRLIPMDGFRYIEETHHRYDAVYLDAFLKPSERTDRTGVPLGLKTIDSYRRMQTKLAEGGVVVVNLHQPTLEIDVAELRQAFARGHLFRVPGAGNYILVGTDQPKDMTRDALEAVGREVDARLRADFSIAALAADRIPEP